MFTKCVNCVYKCLKLFKSQREKEGGHERVHVVNRLGLV